MLVTIRPDQRPDNSVTVNDMPILRWYYVLLRDKWTLAVKLPTASDTHSLWFPEDGTWASVPRKEFTDYSKMPARPVPIGTEISFKIT